MKKLPFLFLILLGCIQTDIEDPFEPILQIDNSISEIIFRVDGIYDLNAEYRDQTGEPTDIPIEWTSSDNAVLSFDGNRANPHAEGQVLITASANGLSETLAIDVLSSRETINISGFVPLKQVGTSATLIANYIDPDGITVDVNPNWSSSSTDIATVDQNGTVTAVAPGNTEISASFGNVTNSMTLEVTTEPVVVDPTIKIITFAMFLTAEDQFQFEAQYSNESGVIDETVVINWSSSDETILTIDANGLATALAPGTVTVEASFENVSTSVSLEVEEKPITERTGMLMGDGYDIQGDFVLRIDEQGDLILTIQNYVPDGPGPYLYLSNINEFRRVDGVNLGPAKSAGNITINVTEIDPSVQLTTYDFLIVWCDPFGVRLGSGTFSN